MELLQKIEGSIPRSLTCSPNYLILGNIQLFITSIWYSNAKSLDFSIVFGVVKSNTWSYIHVVVHRYKLVVLLCPKSLDMNPMWICAFHLLIFYGFSSKLLEPQFKLDDLRNHFCNSVLQMQLRKLFHPIIEGARIFATAKIQIWVTYKTDPNHNFAKLHFHFSMLCCLPKQFYVVHQVLGFCRFQWCVFHSCKVSKKLWNISFFADFIP